MEQQSNTDTNPKREDWVFETIAWTLAGTAILLSFVLTVYAYMLLKTEFAEGPVLQFGNTEEHVAKREAEHQSLVKHMQTVVVSTYKGISKKDAKKVVRLAADEAAKVGLDPKTVVAVIATESSFQPKAKSWYGAAGYMQVVPRLHQDKIKGRDIHEVKTNVEVGVKILASCYKRKKTDKEALACYNGSDSEASAQRYFAKVSKVHKTLSASL